MKKNVIFFAVALIAIDQISKYCAVQAGESILNTGISLGIVGDLPNSILMALLFLLLLVMAVALKKEWLEHQLLAALFFAGSISNIIDRAVYAGVQDWLPIPFTTVYNNLADWYIVIAIIGLLLYARKHHT